MTTHAIEKTDAVILAVDESAAGVGAALVQLAERGANRVDWPIFVLSATGEALRLIHRVEPGVLFMCVGFERLEEAAAMIDALRRRRAQLPLLAIAGEHDEHIECAVRTAGAAHYFALDSSSDEQLLLRTLDALGILPLVRRSHSGLSPPRSRGSPPLSSSRP